MRRPTLPDWIRNHEPPKGWTNVFKELPNDAHLYGTETLFGDWDGTTLLLAKDGCPTPDLREAKVRGATSRRHAERARGDKGGWRTNESLARSVAGLPGGKLYGSATANLLYDDRRWSRSLPGFRDGTLFEYFVRVLAWVVEQMPNLQRVACLGQEAWFLANVTMGRPELARQFAAHRDGGAPSRGSVGGKEITAFALYHPAARVSNDAKRKAWEVLLASA